MAATGGLDADEIFIAGSGHIYSADLLTAMPTDVATAMAATYHDHGFTTEDGVVLTPSSDNYEVMAWQQRTPVRVVRTTEKKDLKFTLLQTAGENFRLAFGGGSWAETGEGTDVYKYTPPTSGATDERAWVIEVIDGTDIRRVCIPKGTVTAIGDINFQGTVESKFEVTVSVNTDDWFILSNVAADAPAA